MDTSRAYKNGRANPNHLFEIFGHFSGHDAMEVCEVSLEHIARNLDFEHFSGHDAMEVREVLLETHCKKPRLPCKVQYSVP